MPATRPTSGAFSAGVPWPSQGLRLGWSSWGARTGSPAAGEIQNARLPRETRVGAVSPVVELDGERERCERARAGDRDALASLLREHGPRLYRSVLLPRLGSAAAAEEALAQTYVKVVERITQFTWQNAGFYPWLRTVALHVAIDQLRKRKREMLFEPADLERELDRGEHDGDPDALERYDLQQSRQRVEALLSQINPRYALAIRLRVLEERSRESAAAELGVSVGTLDVVLHRAMAALKKALRAPGDQEP